MDICRVTLLGHKDHGKSTLIGNLMIQTGSASGARIGEAKRISKSLGRKFEPGFMLDSFSEERQGGLTIDATRAQVLYGGRAFEFIDVPGHEELIKNMISGASNAELAVLMVSAKRGEGIKDQTFRHLFLAGMLGIRKVVVAVNKMDSVGYSMERFEEIRGTLSDFLFRIGFGRDSVRFIPVSAYTAENLVKKSRNMGWYKEGTLLDSIVSGSKGSGGKGELRLSVQGTIEGPGGELLIGKVISGRLNLGERIVVLPQNVSGRVGSIFIKGKRSRSAQCGSSVALNLAGAPVRGLRGSVAVHALGAIKPTRKLDALLFAVEKPEGCAVMRFNGASMPCTMEIKEVIDTTTGRVTGGIDVAPLNAAKVTLRTRSYVIAEPFVKSRELGRFVLYDKGRFSGIGIVI